MLAYKSALLALVLACGRTASWPCLFSRQWCADGSGRFAVVLACRSRERGEQLQAELQAEATRLGNPNPRIEARHWPDNCIQARNHAAHLPALQQGGAMDLGVACKQVHGAFPSCPSSDVAHLIQADLRLSLHAALLEKVVSPFLPPCLPCSGTLRRFSCRRAYTSSVAPTSRPVLESRTSTMAAGDAAGPGIAALGARVCGQLAPAQGPPACSGEQCWHLLHGRCASDPKCSPARCQQIQFNP